MKKEFHYYTDEKGWKIENLELEELLHLIIEKRIKEINLTGLSEDEIKKIKEFLKEKNFNFMIKEKYLLDLVKKNFLKID